MNFRYLHSLVSPYTEVRYDIISKAVDNFIAGIDLFPLSGLALKGEFYQAYPTFDSTSIYSVFAVDRYREYLLRAEYTFDKPVTVYLTYVRQSYMDSKNADNFIAGTGFSITNELKINLAMDYKHGYGGNLGGFEMNADYKFGKVLLLSGGIQYDYYRRPDFTEDNYDYAQRYWIGRRYDITSKTSLDIRFEDNVNENFDHRPLARAALNYKF